MKSAVVLSLGLFGLTSLPVQCQSMQMGFQAGIVLPQSDGLKAAVNDKSGWNGGLHLAIHLGEKDLLRPRLDYLVFPTRTDTLSAGVTTDYKLTDLSIGLDYLHHLQGKDQGVYLLAGLSLNRWKVAAEDISITIIPPAPPVVTRAPADETYTNLGLCVGLGYQFTASMGTEIKYQIGKISESDANLIQAGFTFRF